METYGTGNFEFGYFGGMMDEASGLLYIGNGQYYDPSSGRFLNRDAKPNNSNPYVPFDPMGMLFAPLGLMALVYGSKKKGSKWAVLLVILSFAVVTGMTLSACGPEGGDGNENPPTGTPGTPTPGGPGTDNGDGTPTPDAPSATPISCPPPNTPTPGTPTPIQNLDQYFASLREPYAQYPTSMRLSDAGLDFLKKWELFIGRLYNDGNKPDDKNYYDTHGRGKGYCTIGYGHKVHNLPCDGYPQEDEFKDGITEPRAEKLLREDALTKAEVWIRSYITVRITQTQYDALVSLYYNWGGDRILTKPDKPRLLNSGQYVATADHIRLGPVESGGVYFESLQRRRNEEADMFLLPVIFSNP